jgi:DNA-binding MarR family transcriptional regulator
VTLLAVDSFEKPQPHLVAEHLSQQSQTVTGVLDRLERAGHLTRKRDLNDRRAVRLELTPGGKRLVAAIRSSLTRHIDDVLSGVDDTARGDLSRALKSLDGIASDRAGE